MEKSNQLIILAMFVQSLFPFVMMVKMFTSKKRAVKSGQIRASYFKLNYSTELTPPEEIILINNHYTNLFQVPLVFMVVATLYVCLGLADSMSVIIAWLYVLSRLAHSFIHLGKNYLPHRYTIFAISSVILLVFWLYLLGKIFFSQA